MSLQNQCLATLAKRASTLDDMAFERCLRIDIEQFVRHLSLNQYHRLLRHTFLGVETVSRHIYSIPSLDIVFVCHENQTIMFRFNRSLGSNKYPVRMLFDTRGDVLLTFGRMPYLFRSPTTDWCYKDIEENITERERVWGTSDQYYGVYRSTERFAESKSMELKKGHLCDRLMHFVWIENDEGNYECWDDLVWFLQHVAKRFWDLNSNLGMSKHDIQRLNVFWQQALANYFSLLEWDRTQNIAVTADIDPDVVTKWHTLCRELGLPICLE